MKKFISAFLLLISAMGFAQTDSTGSKDPGIVEVYKPVLTLTYADISRLPANNIVELVNFAFPMLVGSPSEVENFSFIVNGFISINPNAINLARIGRIDFYPNGVYQNQGSLGKKGCFVITLITDEVRNGLKFSTKSGNVFLNKGYDNISSNNSYSFHDAWYSQNELSFLNQKKRSTISSAFLFTSDQRPYYLPPGADLKFNFDQYRLANHLSSRLSGKVGISANFLLAQNDLSTQYQTTNGTGKYEDVWRNHIKHGHASVALDIKPVKEFSNRFVMEGNIYYEDNLKKNVQTPPGYIVSDSFCRTLNSLVVTNVSSYNIHSSKQMETNVSLLLRYKVHRDSTRFWEEVINAGWTPYSMTRGHRSFKFSSYSASTSVFMNWNKFLQVRAGGILEKFSVGGNASLQNSFLFYPEISVAAEFAGILGSRSFGSLNLFASHRKYTRADWEEPDQLDATFFDSPTPRYFSTYFPANRLHAGIGLALPDSKLIFRISFLRDKIKEHIIINTGPITYTNYHLLYKGWSGEVSARIIHNSRTRLQLDGLVMTDKNKMKPDDPSHPQQRQWRNMLRMRAETGNLFLQGSFMVVVNQSWLDRNGNFGYVNDRNLSSLLIGYGWQLKNFCFKNLEISAQSKNLILPKYPSAYAYLNRYVGIGISLSR